MSSIREEIERKLKEKLASGPGKGKIIVASTDGLPIASTLPEGHSQDLQELSAYSTQIVKQVKRLLNEMGYAGPKYIQIKTEDGSVLNIYVRSNKVVIYIS